MRLIAVSGRCDRTILLMESLLRDVFLLVDMESWISSSDIEGDGGVDFNAALDE